jgi:hypothetical protein
VIQVFGGEDLEMRARSWEEWMGFQKSDFALEIWRGCRKGQHGFGSIIEGSHARMKLNNRGFSRSSAKK